MQFIENGPDIPEHLLQAHEDGKVVFFCGAGISYPAGLPDFKELVIKLYGNTRRTEDQKQAIESEQFDIAINLLESDAVGGRKAVREKLFEILQPEWSSLDDNATATHKALLTLGKTREGQMLRLVTTNFDRIFEKVISEEAEKKKREEKEKRYQASLLPVPKNHWDGLVYLHGLLPPDLDSRKLDQLVVSSGDFGLAYFTERWAARFAIELFRNYIVCFVGYSINDLVLRYIIDADRLRGEVSPKIFAFVSYSSGEKEKQEKQWGSKNVQPILYSEDEEHSYLHRTLHSWSEIYQHGKESIVESLAKRDPFLSNEKDDFVGRMLWALSDPNGLPARRFAELKPTPGLNWLEPLSEDRYRHDDLDLFGVPQKSTHDNEIPFSFVKRPSPYDKAPFMSLVNQGSSDVELDRVMWHLGHWLIRHLDDPNLVLWVARQGGLLHNRFALLVQQQLQKFDKLEKEKNQEELEQIRAASPKAIPGHLMRTLWGLILSGRLKQFANHHNYTLSSWFKHFNLAGLTPYLRVEIRKILTPQIKIEKPFTREHIQSGADAPQYMSDLVNVEIVLAGDSVHHALKRRKSNPEWESALPDLLADFNVLLRDALNLMRETGEAEDLKDRSYFDQPSISEHPQNRTFNDWTALIDLTRDAWLATAKKDTEQARLIADGWLKTPYPLFKRLAFFAATEREDVISCQQALSWLLADDNWWLWSVGTQRETMRLLASLARRLDTTEMNQLEQVILQGPPRKMFRQDTKNEDWVYIVDRTIWRRLAKLQASDAELSPKSLSKLESLKKQYSWRLAKDDRDDFPTWLGHGEDIKVDVLPTPHTKDELIEWVHQHHKKDIGKSDEWPDRCKQYVDITADVLVHWANQGEWLEDRWLQAFSAWTDDECLKKSWGRIPKVIIKAPDSLIEVVARDLGWWLEKQANKFEDQEELFFGLIERILKLDHEGYVQSDKEPLPYAINHPLGIAIEALLRWWYRGSLEDGQGLPGELKSLFTKICDTKYNNFRPGRTVLAAHVVTLFRIDEEWTSEHLLPLFDWQKLKVEARAVWAGFLWSPRDYRPLIAAIKQPFLATTEYYDKLGIPSEQYISLLTLVALDPDDTLTKEDLSNATHALPQKGLMRVADELTQMLEGAGEQRRDYWRNRVLPYFQSIWPNSNDFKSPEISASLAQLCIAAQEVFPEAYKELRYWLQPLEGWKADSVVYRLHEAQLSEQFPEEVLVFLDAIIRDDRKFLPDELSDCLKSIRKKQPDLGRNKKFQRLFKLSQINQ